MEHNGILDPINEKHLFALHYIFVSRINRSLQQFKEAWNSHGLRTEKGQTPNQIFTAGMLTLRYSGLNAVDVFESVSGEYGLSEEGASNVEGDDEGCTSTSTGIINNTGTNDSNTRDSQSYQ